jgi:hypothetical protein
MGTVSKQTQDEYITVLKDLKDGSKTDLERIQQLYQNTDPNAADFLQDVLQAAFKEKNLAKSGLSISDIIKDYGKMAAYNAKIGCFEGLLKNCKFPFRDIISTYSYFILPLDLINTKNLDNSLKDCTHQIVFLAPEADIKFEPTLNDHYQIKDRKKEFNFSLKRISHKQMVMFEKVKIGLEEDEKTPFVVQVRYPLTVYSLLVKESKRQSNQLIHEQFVEVLHKKFNNVTINSDLFVESFNKSEDASIKEYTSVNDEISNQFFKILWNYRRSVLK